FDRGEDVAVVVDGEAAVHGWTRDAGDLDRTAGVRLSPARRRPQGFGRGEDVADGVARGAEQGLQAVDAFEVARPAGRAHFAPGGDAAGGVGRDEDPTFRRQGDAERGAAAGDAPKVERAAELNRLPVAGGGVRRGQHLAAVGVVRPTGDRHAQGGRGA